MLVRCVSRFATALLAVVVVGVCGLPVRGAVLYSTFGTGNSYDTGSGRVLGPIAEFDIVAAMPFSVTQTSHINSVNVAVNDFQNEAIVANLYSNNAGEPGTLLYTTQATIDVQTILGSVVSLDFSSFAGTLTGSTTYWLGLTRPVTANDNPSIFPTWYDNGQGLLGTTAFSSDAGASWITSPGDTYAAFSVVGTPLPEPSTVTLAAMAVVGLVVVGRRKFRRG